MRLSSTPTRPINLSPAITFSSSGKPPKITYPWHKKLKDDYRRKEGKYNILIITFLSVILFTLLDGPEWIVKHYFSDNKPTTEKPEGSRGTNQQSVTPSAPPSNRTSKPADLQGDEEVSPVDGRPSPAYNNAATTSAQPDDKNLPRDYAYNSPYGIYYTQYDYDKLAAQFSAQFNRRPLCERDFMLMRAMTQGHNSHYYNASPGSFKFPPNVSTNLAHELTLEESRQLFNQISQREWTPLEYATQVLGYSGDLPVNTWEKPIPDGQRFDFSR